jgi:hypothetical protein
LEGGAVDGLAGDADRRQNQFTALLKNPLALPNLLVDLWRLAAANHVFGLSRYFHRRGRTIRTGEYHKHGYDARDWIDQHPIAVYGVAFAWDEHAAQFEKTNARVAGPAGVLLLAHAAYAALMTGLPLDGPVWQNLLARRDQEDPLICFAFHLYELCHIRDEEQNGRVLNEFLAGCPVPCRRMLELAGFLHSGRPVAFFGVSPVPSKSPRKRQERKSPDPS